MNVRQPGVEKSRSIDDQHLLRLVALLDDLVGDNAVTKPTPDLDVGHRTLAASPESEKLTWWMRAALDVTGRKLTGRAMLHQMRRAQISAIWRRWRQRAEGGFPVGFLKSH